MKIILVWLSGWFHLYLSWVIHVIITDESHKILYKEWEYSKDMLLVVKQAMTWFIGLIGVQKKNSNSGEVVKNYIFSGKKKDYENVLWD